MRKTETKKKKAYWVGYDKLIKMMDTETLIQFINVDELEALWRKEMRG